MKLEVHEFEHIFSVQLEAQTMAEAGMLVRMGMLTLGTQCRTLAHKGGTFEAWIDLPKRKRTSAVVPKA